MEYLISKIYYAAILISFTYLTVINIIGKGKAWRK